MTQPSAGLTADAAGDHSRAGELAALDAILTARATMRGARHASVLMCALGANSRQVNAPSTGPVRAGWTPVPHAKSENPGLGRRLAIEATIQV
jgi:hypothetical protein